jgi:hypothetical protein
MPEIDHTIIKLKASELKLVRWGLNVLCPICGSSVIRRFLIFGRKECHNTACPTNAPYLFSMNLKFKQRVVACRVLKTDYGEKPWKILEV